MNHKQRAFDVVVRHLSTMTARSLKDSGYYCAYRGKGGLKCAVGALIADDECFGRDVGK